MAYDSKALESSYKYKKKNIKRIPLDMQKTEYEVVKMAADKAREPVNGYIKKAINDRLKKEGFLCDLRDDLKDEPEELRRVEHIVEQYHEKVKNMSDHHEKNEPED